MKLLDIYKMERIDGGWPSVVDGAVGSFCGGAIVAASFGIVPLAILLGGACVVGMYGEANGNLD